MSSKISPREDIKPERGEHEYGDVEFADATNKKYPIDTEAHILAAWRYIHQERNADKYSDAEVETIEKKIRHAAKQKGIELHED